jgi:hypothetical protein
LWKVVILPNVRPKKSRSMMAIKQFKNSIETRASLQTSSQSISKISFKMRSKTAASPNLARSLGIPKEGGRSVPMASQLSMTSAPLRNLTQTSSLLAAAICLHLTPLL